jgi:peptidoglycan hydrolase-like protein with peptidoglycan-binding domain
MARTACRERGRRQVNPPVWRHALRLLLLGCLLSSLDAAVGWSLDTKIMQAQQKLGALGYDPGAADGLLGPRTRQALRAFQQDQGLPLTGLLDLQTLEALGFVTSVNLFETLPPRPPPATPWRVVLTYLRYYDTQPASLLPYVTERFRQGLTPYEWIKQTTATLAAQDFLRLSWQIERVEMAAGLPEATSATVYVQSRVRLAGQEITRQEIFSLLPAGEAGWRIDTWRSGPPAAAPTPPQTQSQG